MIKTRAPNYGTMFLITMPISGTLFAALRLLGDLVFSQMFDWDYSWPRALVAGALFGFLFGAVVAFQTRRTEAKVAFQGSVGAFQKVAEKTLAELGYQVTLKDGLMVAHKPPSSRANLWIFEIHLQINENQAVLEGPWITLRKLKSMIETTSSVVREVKLET